MSRKLIIHAHPELRQSIAAGEHNFFNLFRQAFEGRGIGVTTGPQTRLTGHLTRFSRHYHLFQINGAIGKRALNVRQAHLYPYWSLEYPQTRHSARIAAKFFDPELVGGVLAQVFFSQMQTRHIEGDAGGFDQQDYVFVPLQGKLLEQRSWQYADLRGMIDAILTHDQTRNILIKPHPKERYSDAEQALIAELAQHPRISVTEAGIDPLLAHCAYVVTQNSAVAFRGFLHRKQAILFARADFHHICATIRQPGDAAGAFAQMQGTPPLFDKYLFWYLQLHCINGGRETAQDQIIEMVSECGWLI